jgi:hypothetical protein
VIILEQLNVLIIETKLEMKQDIGIDSAIEKISNENHYLDKIKTDYNLNKIIL